MYFFQISIHSYYHYIPDGVLFGLPNCLSNDDYEES